MSENFKWPKNRQDGSDFGDLWTVSTAPVPAKFSKFVAPSKKFWRGRKHRKTSRTNVRKSFPPRMWFRSFNFSLPNTLFCFRRLLYVFYSLLFIHEVMVDHFLCRQQRLRDHHVLLMRKDRGNGEAFKTPSNSGAIVK